MNPPPPNQSGFATPLHLMNLDAPNITKLYCVLLEVHAYNISQ